MILRYSLAILLAVTTATAARADTLRVVTDILPVHSLVSQVFQGIAEPDLLLPAGASPHDASLRPSAAQALENADLVVWIGPELTPQLERPLQTLAGNAQQIALIDLPQTRVLSFEEHEDEAGYDDHHDHSGTDPHAWLDPENAVIWLDEIARVAATLDPENAARYLANAADGKEAVSAISGRAQERLDNLSGTAFATYHDSLRYFENRYGLTSSGSIADSDAVAPSAASLQEIARSIKEQDVTCMFMEPGANDNLAKIAAADLPLKIVEIDLLGVRLDTGPSLYPALIDQLSTDIADCLSHHDR